MAYKVKASVFGGPNDPGTGTKGYRGDDLSKKGNSYAELNNNVTPGASGSNALGNLAYGTPLRVKGPKGSLVLYKRDIGKGGPNGPKIDLWYTAAAQLGVSGIQEVTIESLDPVTAAKLKKALSNPVSFGSLNPLTWNPLKGANDIAKLLKGNDPGDEGISVPEFGLGNLKELFDVLFSILSALTDSGFWIRAGKYLLGFILLVMALTKLGKLLGGGRVVKDTKSVGGAAKKVAAVAVTKNPKAAIA